MTFMPSTCSLIFQSTPPHGERRRYRHRGAWYLRILIHAPRMGSDTSVSFLSVDRDLFQSTLPHGERQAPLAVTAPTVPFQSTLPHGERLALDLISLLLSRISIHAPAWGATSANSHRGTTHSISIHAPAWGATTFGASSGGSYEFQSTLPHGERQTNSCALCKEAAFQSTLPHGERPSNIMPMSIIMIFQSTLPHGERQQKHEISSLFL